MKKKRNLHLKSILQNINKRNYVVTAAEVERLFKALAFWTSAQSEMGDQNILPSITACDSSISIAEHFQKIKANTNTYWYETLFRVLPF
jgi:hypothetical protein